MCAYWKVSFSLRSLQYIFTLPVRRRRERQRKTHVPSWSLSIKNYYMKIPNEFWSQRAKFLHKSYFSKKIKIPDQAPLSLLFLIRVPPVVTSFRLITVKYKKLHFTKSYSWDIWFSIPAGGKPPQLHSGDLFSAIWWT